MDIALVLADKAVTLTVSDDGVGFDVEAALIRPPEGHLGLQVMIDLTAQSDGLLEASSAAGEGTC